MNGAQLPLLNGFPLRLIVPGWYSTYWVKALDGLKGEIQGLLGQADAQKQVEAARMVAVFSAMKPKDAAARMTLLEDSVRLPIAAKMKERTLAAILAQMSPTEAKKMTESLAKRFEASTSLTSAPPKSPRYPQRRVGFEVYESIPSLDWLGTDLSDMYVDEEELDELAGLPDAPFGDEQACKLVEFFLVH
eukprot:gene45244-61301_t